MSVRLDSETIDRLIAVAEDADREAATLGLRAHDQEPGRG